MTGWAPRRFWTEAGVEPEGAGFAVALDGRRVKTPARAALVVPGRALAEAIAAEWQAQGEAVEPATMPLTRFANSAIDTVGPQKEAVAEIVAAYGASDLLCYRAERPEGLAARQAAEWDPLLAWATEALAAPLAVTAGIVAMAQPAASLAALGAEVRRQDPFALAALHELVALSGSLVIGLAALAGHPAERLWRASRVDEDWQRALWGADEEADAVAETRRAAFHEALRFAALARGN